MATIIIVEHNATPTKLGKSIEAARSFASDIIVVGENQNGLELTGVQLISPQKEGSIAKALHEASTRASEEFLVVADARVTSVTVIKSLLEELAQASASMLVTPTEFRGESLDFLEFAPENIVPTIGLNPYLALQTFIVSRSLAQAVTVPVDSQVGWAAAILIEGISRGLEVRSSQFTLQIDSTAKIDEIARIDDRERASILTRAIASNNIEDLFPTHPWSDYHQESAAASYHSLAALFVRLGDVTNAHECLQLSDSLEDSPRSLALKGLIAHRKGEILGAVANLVSSLQQYEVRKRNNGQHYLTFLPKDIENINSKLQAGLEALNKRDNTGAFDFFADAIFSFDDFYEKFGVTHSSR